MRTLILVAAVFFLGTGYAETPSSSDEAAFGAWGGSLLAPSQTVPCASGGPATEAFYESQYQRCLNSYCPSVCTAGGTAKGDYFTDGRYRIVCLCR